MIIDSNIIIYSTIPDYDYLREYLKEQQDNLNVSFISRIEVLGYHLLKEEDRSLFEDFFNSINILNINEKIIDITIFLKQNQKLSLGDSIIAATSIYYDEELLTNNIQDFKNIKNLKLIPLAGIK
jgi:toxin FitB